ncbi:MAG: hypothetical protein ACT4O9_17660 [Blastocatellia bacterium]
MPLFPISSFLRFVLLADAATCILTGLLMTVGGGLLVSLTGLPSDLLMYAGISLLPFGAILLFLGSRREVSSAAIWSVIVINVLWTLDSFLLLASGWIAPTTFGYAFVIFQAVGVGAFAVLEYLGLRHAGDKVLAH